MESSKVETYWDRHHFMASLERYRELTSLLCNNLSYASQLGHAVDSKSANLFASTFVRLLNQDRLLQLIEHLIEEEINATADEALGSLLRGNNSLSKLEVELSKQCGRSWLALTLGPIMDKASKDSAFYEVDPTRVTGSDGLMLDKAQSDPICALGKRAVLQLAQDVLDAVCSKESLEALPNRMARIARRTFECARDRGVEDPLAVAGGYLWLRVLSPALTTPSSAGLSLQSTVLHANSRRRLLLVTKVLQNASNNVMFGKKEPHMLQFNDFITRASQIIRRFIKNVCETKLPVSSSNNKPDINRSNGNVAMKSSGRRIDGSGKAGVESDAAEESELYADLAALDSVEPSTLLSLHRLCALFNDKWMTSLSKKGLMGRSGTRLVKVLGQLGPPPPAPIEEEYLLGGEEEPSQGTAKLTSSANKPSSAPAKSSTHLEVDENAMYWGPSAEVKQLYIVARRLRADLLQNTLELTRTIILLMEQGGCVTKQYDVVFDMTYFTPTTSLSAIFNLATQLYKQLPHSMRKNLRYGIVLHPDRVARASVLFAQAMVSQKANKKLMLCYTWQDLTRWIPAGAIAIPEESKSHILESLSVIKINAAGKRQHRLVKLTSRSLLNIDPQGPRVQNERAIGNIHRITLRGDCAVKLQFVDPVEARKRDWTEETVQQFAEKINQNGGGMLNRLALSMRTARASSSSAQDASERVYEFVNATERNAFVLGILRLGLQIQKRGSASPLPHCFVVNKTGSVGQSQIRIWLLTTDSILNLDTSLKVHSEIGLASIRAVRGDQDRPGVVLIKSLDREEPMEVKTDWREALVAALQDLIPKQEDVETESSHIHSFIADMDDGKDSFW